ncbi:sphingosine kinase 1 isoform X3 [Meriones unguiculatus]|uniref:sphingosine kinase 1 isoform X3 n=1 Tax=Meriones unguiculatus TaxID=10047 RepID=UPI00293EA4A2|nr:sphingosine kinase 1 isoform X3 [Meriones unguiculatus]
MWFFVPEYALAAPALGTLATDWTRHQSRRVKSCPDEERHGSLTHASGGSPESPGTERSWGGSSVWKARSPPARDLAASGNDSGALTAQGGGEGEPHSQSPDILLGNADKERNARAAASPSRARPALVAPCQPEPRTLAMEPAGCPGGLLLPRPCRVLVLLNPGAGKGKALQLFQNHVQPLLEEAEISFKLMVTERQNHAKELVYAEELGHWDALVIMSGDGLIHEVVNGLMERPDWEIAIQKPLCSLPGGSGNAVAASINYYAGYEQVTSEDLLFNCTLLLCRRRLSPMNLLSLHTASGRHLYSVLSLAWGFIADVDLESEKYRRLGEFRFMLGTFCHLVSLRIYQGQLSYLPVGKAASKVPASPALAQEGPVDTHLVPLEEPVPSHWTVVPEQDFVLVLVLLHSHLTRELFAAPTCCREAGIMHLFYIRAGVSRIMLLRLFLAMQKGKHMELDCPYVVHVPVVAFRLEPKNQRGLFAVDGERMACEAVQGQVHPNYFWMVCDSRDGPSSWEPQQRPPPEP